MHAWVNVARFEKAKTIKGGLVARSVAGLPFLLQQGMKVAFVPPQIDVPRSGFVQSISEVSDSSAVVTFDAVNSLDIAEQLVGTYCLVRRADLPEDELLFGGFGLEGFEVHDRSKGFVGLVSGVEQLPGQNLLKVDRTAAGADGVALIPLVDALIVAFDEELGRIDVCLPDGLLDL